MEKIIRNSRKIKYAILLILLAVAALLCFVSADSLKSRAEFIDADIKSSYEKNSEFAIPEVFFNLNDTRYKCTPVLSFPDGSVFGGETAVLSQAGEYKLSYKLLVDGKLYEKTYSFSVLEHLYSIDGNGSSVKYGTHEYLGEKRGIVVTLTGGSVFTYNKPLNISSLTEADKFIKYYILPSKIGDIDLNKIELTLTDVNDSENFITITAKSNVNNDFNLITTVNASNGQLPTGLEPGISELYPKVIWNSEPYKLHAGNAFGSYVGGLASFSGTPKTGDITTNSVSYFMDYANKAVFNQFGVIADLDDILQFSKPWQGFSTGEVYLSICGRQFTGDSATIMITDIMEEDLSVNSMEDNTPPVISIDTEGYSADNLPEAVVGEKYRLFSAKSSDNTHGIKYFAKKVFFCYYNELKAEEEILEDNFFIPSRVGKYTIEYCAVDYADNETIKFIDVKAVKLEEADKPNISFGTDFSSEANVGSAVKVKSFTVENNIGRADLKIHAVSNSAVYEVPADTLSFVPFYSGDYSIIYEYKDYVFSFTKEYNVTIAPSDRPYIDTDGLEIKDRLIKNASYVFPQATAYIFKNGNPETTNSYIMTYDDDSAEGVLHGNSDKIKITASTKVKLRYIAVNPSFITDVAGCDIESSPYVVYKDFETSVADVGFGNGNLQMDKLFESNNDFTSVTNTDSVIFTPNAQAVTQTQGTIKFLNDVYVFGFGFKAKFTAGYSSVFTVILSDAETGNTVYKISYMIRGEQITIGVNDVAEYVVSHTVDNIDMSFDVENMVMVPYGSVKVNCDKTYNGKPFAEILNKKFTVSFNISNITEEAQLTLYKICNQPLSNLKTDMISPILSQVDCSGSYSMGTVFDIPVAYSYDVIDPFTDFTLKVLDPEGNVAVDTEGVSLNNVTPLESRKIKLDKYGYYKFVFNSSDSGAGIAGIMRRTIEVIDTEKPSITLEEYKTDWKVGEKITVAKAVVSDNKSTELDLKKYYIATDGRIVVLEGDTFSADKIGRYTIYYSVSDEQGNVCTENYNIEVK